MFDPGLQRPCNYLQGVFHTQQVFGAVAAGFLIVLVAEYGLVRLGPLLFFYLFLLSLVSGLCPLKDESYFLL